MRQFIPARVILFPGLGADARVFDRMHARLGGDLECPDWLTPQDGESFDAYAKRWAAILTPMPGDDRPVFLAGVSFGGMVALRMAPYLKPKAVILIGSCRSVHAKPRRWVVADRLGNLIPQRWLGRRILAGLALWVSLVDRLDTKQRALLMRMAAESDPMRVRWSARQCALWDFDPDGFPDFPPVHQIHGKLDAIIPLIDTRPDVLIPDGRHLIHLSHEQTVCRFLMDVIRRHVRS
ncbi:MAG: alpha/beta hydrolase [Phycisphaeraceae bacterium]